MPYHVFKTKRNEKVKMKYMTFHVAGGWKNCWRFFFPFFSLAYYFSGIILVENCNVA